MEGHSVEYSISAEVQMASLSRLANRFVFVHRLSSVLQLPVRVCVFTEKRRSRLDRKTAELLQMKRENAFYLEQVDKKRKLEHIAERRSKKAKQEIGD